MLTDKNDNLFIGSSALILEIFLSMLIAIIVKYLSPTVPVVIVLFARYLFSLPILFAIGAFQRKKNILQINDIKTLSLRIIAGFLGLLFWFLAVSAIEISKATALLQTIVFFITIFSHFILNEKITRLHLLAVLIGFLGAIILIDPNTTGWLNFGVLYGLAAPLSAAFMFVFLRRLGKSEVPISTALWYNLFGTLLTFFWILITETKVEISYNLIIILCLLGAIASFQQFLLPLSHKFSEASILAPLQYLAIPMAIATGHFLFKEAMNFHFFFGTFVIVGSSYFIFLNKKANRK